MSITDLSLESQIDALLPQTQCTRCGYPACRDYANAIARGDADINQCPPGGSEGIVALANLLHRPAKPLNPANGIEKPFEAAVIDEEICIGCTKCIAACPVDAIVGAPKLMHTVIEHECSGCELCIAPCPVDCIRMVVVEPDQTDIAVRAAQFRARYEARNARLTRIESEREAELAARKATAKNPLSEAIERARSHKRRALEDNDRGDGA